jgi:hypothetical protein
VYANDKEMTFYISWVDIGADMPNAPIVEIASALSIMV